LTAGLPGTNRQNLTRQGTDINFIKLSGSNLQRASVPFYRTLWFFAVASVPVVFNIGVVLYRRERARQSLNVVLTRSRRARRAALRRLRRAMRTGRAEPRRFYDEAAAALSGYLEDKFNLPEIALTGDVLERTFTEKSVAPETVKEAVKCLEDCDFGRFVSASPAPEKMAHLANRIRTAIDRLEQS
jgi:hypothetical protein